MFFFLNCRGAFLQGSPKNYAITIGSKNHIKTKSKPNPNPTSNPTTKQHALVNIQLNIVIRPIYTYPDKFIRDTYEFIWIVLL